MKTRQEEEEGREGKVRVSQQQVCDETARPKLLSDEWIRKNGQVRSKTFARVSTRHWLPRLEIIVSAYESRLYQLEGSKSGKIVDWLTLTIIKLIFLYEKIASRNSCDRWNQAKCLTAKIKMVPPIRKTYTSRPRQVHNASAKKGDTRLAVHRLRCASCIWGENIMT